MRSTIKRLALLLLALVLLLSFCACKKTEEGGNKGEVEQGDDEVPVDLGGYEFTVIDYVNSRWNKELAGTPNTDAWIQVMDEVETLYNCTISANYVGSVESFTVVQPEIVAGGKYADLIVTTQHQAGYFIGANLYMDLNKLDVNWDNPWWNQDTRNITTVGNKTYCGNGSFIFDTSYTWVLHYNEAVWNELGLPNPYELVDSHKWTYDLFRDYCIRACQDLDNSGAMDSPEDRWGVMGSDGDFTRAWFFSLGGKYFENDKESGKIKLACNTPKIYDIADKMYTMVKKDKCVFQVTQQMDGMYRYNHFAEGRALFWACTPGQNVLKDMEDDWGVIPMPLYDEQQEDYLSGVDHNSAVFGVANTNQDLHEVSVLLEALGRHAMILEDIYWPDYKETYWRHEEQDTRMMSQYVVGHGRHDMAVIMQNCNAIFRAPMDRMFATVFGAAGPDYSSYIDMVQDPIETGLEDYFNDIEDSEETDDAGETSEA